MSASNNNNNSSKGLAADIRACTESETFDMGGVANIESVVEQAFGESFVSLSETMIRITLIVGAGKQARQKYDVTTTRKVTSTLQKVGYQEDRGASCVLECAGMYKLQHDTGKNLKTVVVFPKIVVGTTNNNNNNNGGNGGNTNNNNNTIDYATDSFLFPPNSLEYKVAACSLQVFENMIPSKFPTWLEQKALQQLLEEHVVSKLQQCDDLLIKGTQLNPSQQEFYDNMTTDIHGKMKFLKQSMHTLVDTHQLTKHELEVLQRQVLQRISDLNQQSKPVPKVLLERKQKLQTMNIIVDDDSPTKQRRLKHHAELGKLWKQIQPIWHIQESSSGSLLSVQQTKLLGQKNELLDEIHRLEQASQGWLEEDVIFQQRVDACRKEFQQKYSIKNNSGGGGGSKKKGSSSNTGGGGTSIGANTKVRVPVTKWVTPGQKFAEKQAKKKSKLKRGDVFGAMMAAANDSGSDDDEDDHEDHEEEDVEEEEEETSKTAATGTSQQQQQQQETATSSPGKKNKKKKKNNNNNKNKKKSLNSEDRMLDEAVAKNAALAKKEKEAEDETKSSALPIVILRDIIFPIIMAIITWILAMILGTKGGKNNNNNKQNKKKKN